MQRDEETKTTVSVLGGSFDPIDDDDLNRCADRLQAQPGLLLEGGDGG